MLEIAKTVNSKQQNELYRAMLDEQAGENMLNEIIKDCKQPTLKFALLLVQKTLHTNSEKTFSVFNSIFLSR